MVRMADRLTFTKGHGTENDFVLVPDLDGALGLTAARAAALADRRAGIGGDGVIRVVPADLADDPAVRAQAGSARWFMDYRNADGSLSEMCGNGTRVFAAYLRREGLETADEFAIATRAGVKHVRLDGDGFAVDLGPWRLTDPETAERDGFDALVHLDDDGDPCSALRVDLGNPHTVVALPEAVDLDTLDLTRAPGCAPSPSTARTSSWCARWGPGTSRCACTSAASARPGRAEPAPARRPSPRASGRGASTPGPPGWSTCPGAGSPCALLPDHGVELAGPAVLVADGTIDLAALSAAAPT